MMTSPYFFNFLEEEEEDPCCLDLDFVATEEDDWSSKGIMLELLQEEINKWMVVSRKKKRYVPLDFFGTIALGFSWSNTPLGADSMTALSALWWSC